MSNPEEEIIPAKTQHFTFNIHKFQTDTSIGYIVASGKKQCLELIIPKPNTMLNEFHLRLAQYFAKDISNRAHLVSIESLYECIIEPLDTNTFNKHSFGTELLQYMIEYIKIHHPYIREIKLSDKSKIICNRAVDNDNMDLLTYYIALYGITWYEKMFNAYYENNNYNKDYKNTIKYLRGSDFKNILRIEDLLHFIEIHNMFAFSIINKDIIIDLYNKSSTLPEFLIMINKQLDKRNKCKFYKTWLEELVKGVVKPIIRDWIIPINQRGGRAFRRKTRKFRKN